MKSMLHKIIKATLVGTLLISSGINASTTDLKIEQDGFVGKYYPSASNEQRVAVLVLGGSE